MWPGGPSRSSINYGLPHDMGMVGLRDVFVMAGPHHHHHHGVGVIPLLTTAPCLPLEDDSAASPLPSRSSRSGLQPWQQSSNHNSNQPPPSSVVHHHHQHSQQPHFFKKPPGNIVGFDQESPNFAAGIGASIGSGSGTATCQDCGNQAKKDCTHRRCRTCCKSRGFDCATHVKSTWVPAARRRERQLITTGCGGGGGGPVSSGSTSGAKKPRLIASQTTTTSHTSTSNTTPPRSFDTSSSHQDAGFKETLPGQVRAPAVFKCVRVTAVEDGEDEYAYQAVVKIGGHVFKGFLYDQGVENNSRQPIPNMSELHLGGAGRNNAGGGSTSPIIDPADVYGGSGSGGFLQAGGCSSYGNPIN